MMKVTILLVEDTDKMAVTVRDYLSLQGYEVIQAMDGKEALELYDRMGDTIDLVLLDLMLPMIGGYEVLRELRKKTDVPVIIISARSEVENQMTGFTIGADDYLVKPFSLKLLKLHIEAVLKRAGKYVEIIKEGALTVDIASHQVSCGGREIIVTPKEYDLLVYFLQHKEMVLDRSTIIDRIWGYDYIGEIRTVDTIVKQLRKKLLPECDHIQTVYGVGYVWKENRKE